MFSFSAVDCLLAVQGCKVLNIITKHLTTHFCEPGKLATRDIEMRGTFSLFSEPDLRVDVASFAELHSLKFMVNANRGAWSWLFAEKIILVLRRKAKCDKLYLVYLNFSLEMSDANEKHGIADMEGSFLRSNAVSSHKNSFLSGKFDVQWFCIRLSSLTLNCRL